ncbi:MAG: KamA family radical SAM protein [Thermodesulfobacteriota bacterium]
MELVAQIRNATEKTSEALKPSSPEEDQPPSLPLAERAARAVESPPQLVSAPKTPRRRSQAGPLRAVRRSYSPVINPGADRFRLEFFPDTLPEAWNDWRWQLSQRITSLKALAGVIELSPSEKAAFDGAASPLPLSITPYYLSLLDRNDQNQPLRRCVVPTVDESLITAGEANDPLAEDHDSIVPGLVHRYPDRVLLLATGFCSSYCRYCTRSRLVAGRREDCAFDRKRLEEAFAYIQKTAAVRDVLISGGDPLTLSDEDLEWIIRRLRRIDHVELIRIGTKVPVVLPQRVTPALASLMKKYHPLFMSIHFTHPAELTPETAQACRLLADAGVPLGSQTVLLKGINDEVAVIKALMQGLLKIRVRPYYLYQCDPISGSAHFRTPVSRGLEIIQGLRGHTTGYAVPTYVIDSPGGGGKIALYPDAVVERRGTDLVLRNYEGLEYTYPDDGGRKAMSL